MLKTTRSFLPKVVSVPAVPLGCSGSVARTDAKLGPAWRLMFLSLVLGRTSAAGSGVNFVLHLVPTGTEGGEVRVSGDGVVDHFVNRTDSLTGVGWSLYLFSGWNCTSYSFFLERILLSYNSLIPKDCMWAVEVRLFR